MSESFSWEAFNKIPVVGILRNVPPQHLQRLFQIYLEADLTTIEVTMNSPGATEAIASLLKTFDGKLNIGAGTVCSLEELDKALKAGAQFIVTPVLKEEVLKACVQNNVPVFAGAFTPTEIYRAWELGASLVKVFPASQLGPSYIKEVLAPLNQIKLLPTGGITEENFTVYLQAGALGLGMGSSLIPKSLIEKEQWEELKNHLSGFVEKYNQFKQQNN